MEKDYLAVIMLPGGSSWGRSSDKEEAINNAVKSVRDWKHLFKVSNVEVTVNVVDVTGYNEVVWSDIGWYRDGEKFKPVIEKVKRTTPKWR